MGLFAALLPANSESAATDVECRYRVEENGAAALYFAVASDAAAPEMVPVERLDGEPDQWHIEGLGEFLVIRDYPPGTTFEQFAGSLEQGMGAACGLQPIQRVDSYWDGAKARSYCIYRAGGPEVLRDAFLWLGLPAAVIRPIGAMSS